MDGLWPLSVLVATSLSVKISPLLGGSLVDDNSRAERPMATRRQRKKHARPCGEALLLCLLLDLKSKDILHSFDWELAKTRFSGSTYFQVDVE